MDDCNILFCCDENFILPLYVACQSLKKNWSTSKGLNIYVLHSFSEALVSSLDKSGLFDCCCFKAFPQDLLQQCPSDNPSGIAGYFRLFAPNLFPHLQKIIYLDSDILVKGDLLPLWNEDINGFIIGACYNFVLPKMGLANRFDDKFKDCYSFNSGVLVMNLTEMRLKGFTDEVMEMIKKTRKLAPYFPFGDQDAMNILYAQSTKFLSNKWNFSYFHYNYWHSSLVADLFPEFAISMDEGFTDTRIVHFAGKDTEGLRPWNMDAGGPLNDEWWEYAKKFCTMLPTLWQNLILDTSDRKAKKLCAWLDKIQTNNIDSSKVGELLVCAIQHWLKVKNFNA